MSYSDNLRLELEAATERLSLQRAPRPKWRRLSARTVGIGVAGLAATATAIGASSAWKPWFGSGPEAPQPSIAQAAPSEELMSLLGVLRRPQSGADRGLDTREALRYIGTSRQGIYTDYIRQLPVGDGGFKATLIPVSSAVQPTGPELANTVCLFVAEASGDGGASGCYSAAQIASGAASGALGSVFYALVPDGVAAVVLHDERGTHTVKVIDNFVEDAGAGSRRGTPRQVEVVRWLGGDGRPSALQPSIR
ncbi:MAG: hypothetical protein ACJ762_06455 [Solirubrobacteraceae bacterium]